MEKHAYIAPRYLLYPQIMVGISGIVLLAAALLYGLEVRPGYALAAGMIVFAATVAMVVVRVRPQGRHSAWIALIPIADIVGFGVQRGSFFEPIPLAGLVMAIPLAWLAFAFPLPFTVAGVAAVSTWPLVVYSTLGIFPAAANEVVGILLYSGLGAVFAAAIVPIGRQFRREKAVSDTRASTLAAILTATENGILVVGGDGRLEVFNDAARDQLVRAGVDLSTATPARRPWHVYGADRTTRVDTASLRVGTDGVGNSRTVWVGPPGDQIAVRYVSALIDPEDPSVGTIFSASDVTELLESIEMRDTFLEVMSHELRTPLTVVMARTDQAIDEQDPIVLRERVKQIDESLTVLRDSIERLLLAHREKVSSIRDATDITLAIDEALQRVAPRAEEALVEVRVQVTRGMIAQVNARGLALIVYELLKNAIAFTRAGGFVEVRAYAGEGGPVIEVVDSGVGMSPDERRRAFERFYRAPYAKQNAIPGAGLGLSLVAAVAARSLISVELSGNSAGGTTVTLELPAH
ncbi:HAMP domain-containing sensor histidine kinase [Microbacterium sediminicola]|uniref:sensor histidine kinase n=1 Tax=Microbacterium sediminicola TaxID=415210 RepID=UPI0031DB4BE1